MALLMDLHESYGVVWFKPRGGMAFPPLQYSQVQCYIIPKICIPRHHGTISPTSGKPKKRLTYALLLNQNVYCLYCILMYHVSLGYSLTVCCLISKRTSWALFPSAASYRHHLHFHILNGSSGQCNTVPAVLFISGVCGKQSESHWKAEMRM